MIGGPGRPRWLAPVLLVGSLREEVGHRRIAALVWLDAYLFVFAKILRVLNTRLLLRDVLLHGLKVGKRAHLGATNDCLGISSVRVLADRLFGVLDDLMAMSRAT